jgi:hypothetical protein
VNRFRPARGSSGALLGSYTKYYEDPTQSNGLDKECVDVTGESAVHGCSLSLKRVFFCH